MADNADWMSTTIIVRSGLTDGTARVDDDRAHYLVVVEGRDKGRRIEFGEKHLVIGRVKPADIVLTDEIVSRNHCRVGLVMGELFVTDQGSSNGTFVAGKRISSATLVAPGERIAVGTHVLEHEWRSRREVEAAQAADSDIEKAKQYVRSLLPARIREGPVRTDWVLQPSAKLGGDLFGHHFIDQHRFAIYLLDVTGHGADAAMHAVSVMNVVRQESLPGLDVSDPCQLAAHLNEMFQMDTHGGMLLSLWYGVFDLKAHTLAFTSAGHHAAYLVGPNRDRASPLDVSNVLIGMMPGYKYKSGRVDVAAGSSLYLFSDGAFEIDPVNGAEWGMLSLVQLLTEPAQAGTPESERILTAVKARTGRQAFEDDFTLVVATLE